MRIAYLDCFSGISGDMFVGALVDAGVPLAALEKAVEALGVGARLESKRVLRNGISATKVDVWIGDVKEEPGIPHEQEHAHPHEYERPHEHHHAHGHEHHHHHEEPRTGTSALRKHSHEHSHGRSLSYIREMVSAAKIDAKVKQRALEIFQHLGEAEAKIHNKSLEQIHFHEVGAIDAIADIVCAAMASEELGVDEWISSPINVGGGTVECAHGRLPVPAPATLEMLRDVPVYSSGIDKELTTPTGAAIVKALVKRFGPVPAFKVSATGYGAGGRDLPEQPNVLRISVGESVAVDTITPEIISVLEANLDDLNPQVFGSTFLARQCR
jgi:uncharacterized protein (DUF111 family)